MAIPWIEPVESGANADFSIAERRIPSGAGEYYRRCPDSEQSKWAASELNR